MAYFLLSKQKVLEQWNKLKDISDLISYSYKTNPVVGDVINELIPDALFSIHSFANIKMLPHEIIFFLQGHDENEIKFLLNKGITKFVVDNENDLLRLLHAIEKSKISIELFLRLKFKEHTIYTGKHFVYGFKWQDGFEWIDRLKNNDLIKSFGIHFHRKTQNVGEWDIEYELKELQEFDSWKYVKIINIGGGLPWKYINSQPDLDEIIKKIIHLKEFLNSQNKRLMLEPGRFIAAPSVRLITKVKNVYDNTIIVDASIFNAYMDTFLLNLRLKVKDETDNGIPYLIKGYSPDSLDIFRYRVYFDHKINVDDEIVFLDAGAYNFYTEFGNLPKLEYKIVDKFEE